MGDAVDPMRELEERLRRIADTPVVQLLELDSHVAGNTRFRSWEEMLEAAGEEWARAKVQDVPGPRIGSGQYAKEVKRGSRKVP